MWKNVGEHIFVLFIQLLVQINANWDQQEIILVVFVAWMAVSLNYWLKKVVVSPSHQIANTIVFGRCNTEQLLSFPSLVHALMFQSTVPYVPFQFQKLHKQSGDTMLFFI